MRWRSVPTSGCGMIVPVRAATRPVALGARRRPHAGAGLRQRTIDRVGILRHRRLQQVVGDAAQARARARIGVVPARQVAIDPLLRGAVPQRRRQHDLAQVVVQAVPVIRLPVAALERPHRHHVGVADGGVDRLLQHPELHRVERIDPAAAPVGPRPHPAFLGVALPEQLAARRGDDGEPVEQPIHQREPRVPRDLGEQRVGVEARVGGSGEQEADVLLRRRLMRRGGGDDRRRLVRAGRDSWRRGRRRS